MADPNRLVVVLSNKGREAMEEIMENKEMKRTEATVWAFKYANLVRKMVGEDGAILIEKDGKVERVVIL